MRVFLSGSSNEPAGLLAELVAQPERAAGVTFVQFPLAGLNTTDLSALHPEARVQCFFATPALRDGMARGRIAFVPMQMRAVYDYLAEQRFDIVLTQAAYDRDGVLRLGPNVDFVGAALRKAKALVVEINAALTAPPGCPRLPETRVDQAVLTDRRVAGLPAVTVDDTARAIAAHVLPLIADGDCIQTGIGAIPAAILAALEVRNDLGMHSGLIDDAGLALIERGNMTGLRKTIDTGVHITGAALGTTALLDGLACRSDVVFHGANYTHEVAVIRQLQNFVSINSAVEVDLYGQVNAEFAGGRQISGTGGSVDFMRAARASTGGRSIVAMNATARGGSVSRIVVRAEMVTALRTDVDRVVTEYGVAELAAADVDARAAALIAIAAPAFRDELAAAWREKR
jgi:4-hydroxybutyrate CoA-transferase